MKINIKYVISLLSVLILVYAQKNSGRTGTGYPGIPNLKRKMELLLGSPNPSRVVDLGQYSLIEVIQGLDNLSRKCRESINQLVEDFRNISHITQEVLSKSPIVRMLDAWGKPGAGFLNGNVYMLGAYDECRSVDAAKYCRATVVVLKNEIQYGVCVPESCSASDVLDMMQAFESVLQGYNISINTKKLPTCEKPMEYNRGSIATLVVFGIILCLCLIGTFTEVLQDAFTPSTEFIPKETNLEESNEANLNHNPGLERVYLISSVKIRRGNTVTNVLISFSLLKNTRAILSTAVPKGAITSVNGIRTISMTWVILGHVYFFSTVLLNLDNIIAMFTGLRKLSFLPIANAYVSVDTFFLLSGLLVAYLTLRRFDNNGLMSVTDYLLYLLHRYLRLTPSLAILMLFFTYLFPLTVTGPWAMDYRGSDAMKPCLNYWWTNLLYINNFYPPHMMDQCVGWVWYLANDWQFYVVSPLILTVIYKLEIMFRGKLKYFIAFAVLGFLCVISFVVIATMIVVNDYPTLITAMLFPNNPRVKGGEGQDEIYEKPYCRIPPYLVGLGLGYILSRRLEFKACHRLVADLIGWSCSITVALAIIYGPWHVFRPDNPYFMSDIENVLYGTLHRFAFALCVGWVIYSCHNQKGLGIVNDILSWKAWIPLSRLTYGAYLMHPCVLIWFYHIQEKPIHYQDNLFAMYFIAVTVVSYICGFVLAVCVEQPMASLEKIIFRR